MTSPYGMLSHIGVGQETVWGTAVAATDYFEALSESIAHTIERFETANLVGGLYEPDDQAGMNRFGGDIALAANADNLGFLLKGATGIQSETVIQSGFLHQYQYTFPGSDAGSLSALPPMTFEVARGGVNTAFQFAGCQVNALALAVAVNQDVRVTAGILAKNGARIARTTPTFPGSPVAPFAFKTTSVQIAGAAVTHVEALNFSLDNQLEGVPFLNATSVIGAMRRNGPQLVRLGGTLEFRDFTDYDAFANQTEQRMVASWTLADSFSLIIDIPRAVFTEYPVQVPGRERVTVDFSMKGLFHTGSNNAMRFQLSTTNTY